MNDSTDRRLHPDKSTTARCLVCGGLFCGPSVHGLYKTQLAESAGEIKLALDPVVINGRVVGYCLLAETYPAVCGQAEIDSVYIAGDCGIEAV